MLIWFFGRPAITSHPHFSTQDIPNLWLTNGAMGSPRWSFLAPKNKTSGAPEARNRNPNPDACANDAAFHREKTDSTSSLSTSCHLSPWQDIQWIQMNPVLQGSGRHGLSCQWCKKWSFICRIRFRTSHELPTNGSDGHRWTMASWHTHAAWRRRYQSVEQWGPSPNMLLVEILTLTARP